MEPAEGPCLLIIMSMFKAMAVTCNGTVPCIVEGYGARLYYIPYEYGTIIGPEQWWHDYDKVGTFLFFFRFFFSVFFLS